MELKYEKRNMSDFLPQMAAAIYNILSEKT